MNERNQAISLVNAALPPLKKIDELYNTANAVIQQANAVETASVTKNTHGATIRAFLAAGITYSIIDVIVVLLIGLTNLVFLAFIGFPAAIYICIRVFKATKEKFSKPDNQAVSKIQQSNQYVEQISKEIEQIVSQNAEILTSLPRDYRTYYAVSFFESALANGRADSLKEAMNLYENHLHQMRMENMNKQMIYNHDQQLRMMTEIEQSTKETTKAVNFNTAFNIMRYI